MCEVVDQCHDTISQVLRLNAHSAALRASNHDTTDPILPRLGKFTGALALLALLCGRVQAFILLIFVLLLALTFGVVARSIYGLREELDKPTETILVHDIYHV